VSDTLGWIYYKKGLASQAVSALNSAVAKAPQNATFQYHLGLAMVAAGDGQGGRKALEKALALDPKFEGAGEARKAIASIK